MDAWWDPKKVQPCMEVCSQNKVNILLPKPMLYLECCIWSGKYQFNPILNLPTISARLLNQQRNNEKLVRKLYCLNCLIRFQRLPILSHPLAWKICVFQFATVKSVTVTGKSLERNFQQGAGWERSSSNQNNVIWVKKYFISLEINFSSKTYR